MLFVLDYDECKTGSHGCQQQCTNEHGSYSCTCVYGYILNDNNKICS